jgi:threonine dehydrogenase-like Zn-dependent dehydrogenase
MATKMDIAALDLVELGTAGAQRVAVLEDPYKIGMRYARIPEPGHGEIRIKMRYVGICGSDLESYRGVRSPEFLSTPSRLGHEVSGVIDALGPGVCGLQIGQRVSCRYVWGAFAEYIVCKPFNLHVVPEHLRDEDISPIEVLPGIIHAAELSQITTNTDVLIMGQGVSALVMTQVVSLFAPRNLVVTDLKDHNLALARHYGATHTYKLPVHDARTMEAISQDFPDGFEVVIPCLLEGAGMIDAVDCASMGGRIIMYGCIGTCEKPFDWLKVHRKRLSIFSTEPRRDIDMRRWFTEGVQMVEQGLVNVAEMITHTFTLDQIAEAFEKRDEQLGDAIHIMIDCEN